MDGQWILKPSLSSPPAVTGAPPPSMADSGSHLTMDALLSYCETRLRNLDGQVRNVFKDQEKARADAATLAGLANAVNAFAAGGVDGSGSSVHSLIRYYEFAAAQVGRDTPLGQKILAEQQSLIKTMGKDGGAALLSEMSQGDYWSKDLGQNADKDMIGKNLNTDEVKGMITRVKDLQTEVNSGTELGMVTLQSLMSQRQMAIQLATQLVQSLGDMTNKIAANIGR